MKGSPRGILPSIRTVNDRLDRALLLPRYHKASNFGSRRVITLLAISLLACTLAGCPNDKRNDGQICRLEAERAYPEIKLTRSSEGDQFTPAEQAAKQYAELCMEAKRYSLKPQCFFKRFGEFDQDCYSRFE